MGWEATTVTKIVSNNVVDDDRDNIKNESKIAYLKL